MRSHLFPIPDETHATQALVVGNRVHSPHEARGLLEKGTRTAWWRRRTLGNQAVQASWALMGSAAQGRNADPLSHQIPNDYLALNAKQEPYGRFNQMRNAIQHIQLS